MTIAPMLRAESAKIELLDNRVTALIARHRKLLFLVLGLLLIGSFNGRWRLGLDSANYRGLALSIASGKGYTFGLWAPKQAYPGLPYVLAGIEWLFGPADRTPSLAEQQRLLGPSAATTISVLFIVACAAMTLVVVYRLVKLHYPIWVAVTITCGVGTNSVFLEQSQTLMTDVPFLLGVMTSLYGWDLLRRAQDRGARIKALAVLAAGLALAASMRPMFWILAIAWMIACVWGLIRGPQRRFHAACLGILLLIWTIAIALDPRFGGFHPFAGGYEREALTLLPRMFVNLTRQVQYILHDQLPAAVFGEQLAPFSVLGSLVVLGSTLLLLRRHLLWVLLVIGTFLVTIPLSSEPRYYTMVLPVMLLGWLVLFCGLGRRVPRFWGEVILSCALAIVTLNNLSASVHLYIEQHRPDFLQHYKRGEYVRVLEMADQIRQHVPPDAKVLGPSGSIMSVFSGVHVYTQRELLPRGPDSSSPAKVAAARLDYVIVPARLYMGKEPAIARMITKRIIRRQTVVARTSNMILATVKVYVPDPKTDWRKSGDPLGLRRGAASTTQPATARSE